MKKIGIGLLAGGCVLLAAAATLGHREWRAPEKMPVAASGAGAATSAAIPMQVAGLPADTKVQMGTWSYVGPANVAGASPSIAVDPYSGALYTVSRDGWVFKSTDGAGTWMAVRRFDTPYKLAKLELQADASGVRAFLAVTEPIDYVGTRLLRMTPDGETLQQLPDENIVDVEVVGNLIYVVGHEGAWMSDDDALYWQHLVADDGDMRISCWDVEAMGSNVYLACKSNLFWNTSRNDDIWRSQGGGQFTKTWTAPVYDIGLPRLAIAKSNPQVVYVAYGNGGRAFIYKSTDGGTSFNPQNDPYDAAQPFQSSLLDDFEAVCASINAPYPPLSVLEVDPTNPDVLWIGGRELYRSNDGGVTFGRAAIDDSKGLQPYHVPGGITSLVFSRTYNGGTNRNMYLGTPRGVHSTADARAAVQPATTTCANPGAAPAMKWQARIKGLTTTDFEAVDVHANGEVLATLGAGANGSLFYGDLADANAWGRLSSEHPKRLSIDPQLGLDRFFTSKCAGAVLCRWDWNALQRRWNVTTSVVDTRTYPGDDAFMAADPGNRQRYWSLVPEYGAAQHMSRSGDAMGSWDDAGHTENWFSPVVAGAVSPLDPNVVLIAEEQGDISRQATGLSADANTTWARVNSSSFKYTGLQFDPTRPQRVFATTKDGYLQVSTDGGVNWSYANHTGDGLPLLPGYHVAAHPENTDIVFLGMEHGVYVSWNYAATQGKTWFELPAPFAGTAVRKLILRKNADGIYVLYAFTAGRGIWAATVRVQRFNDVPLTHWAYDFVDRLARAGITGGCATSPLRYCPTQTVPRDQMAVFLLRAKHGKTYQPPAASGDFGDVPTTHWAAAWIERLRDEGITGGCATNPLRYCPTDVVKREQIAVFLLRAKYGANYQPPAATGMYEDVPTSYWAAAWIEQLSREGIAGGCSTTPKNFCPTVAVSRDQMAAFLVRGFGL